MGLAEDSLKDLDVEEVVVLGVYLDVEVIDIVPPHLQLTGEAQRAYAHSSEPERRERWRGKEREGRERERERERRERRRAPHS